MNFTHAILTLTESQLSQELISFRNNFQKKELRQTISGSKHNKWNKLKLRFESPQRAFRVLIEAVIGKPGLSDMAIDDVVFQDGCRYLVFTVYRYN